MVSRASSLLMLVSLATSFFCNSLDHCRLAIYSQNYMHTTMTLKMKLHAHTLESFQDFSLYLWMFVLLNYYSSLLLSSKLLLSIEQPLYIYKLYILLGDKETRTLPSPSDIYDGSSQSNKYSSLSWGLLYKVLKGCHRYVELWSL